MRFCRAGLLTLFILLALSAFAAFAGPSAKPPAMEQGLLDLSHWKLQSDGPVKLDGQWEFYWNQLLAPADFASGSGVAKITGYLNFPGSWKGFVLNGQVLPGTGQATFRLRIIPGQNIKDAELVLRPSNK